MGTGTITQSWQTGEGRTSLRPKSRLAQSRSWRGVTGLRVRDTGQATLITDRQVCIIIISYSDLEQFEEDHHPFGKGQSQVEYVTRVAGLF